jgi:hypothetical protein
MKFMRRTAGYSLLNRSRNEDNLEELQVDTVEKKLVQYKQKWLNHLRKSDDIRYKNLYRPMGRRRVRPLKTLLDGCNLEAETRNLLA